LCSKTPNCLSGCMLPEDCIALQSPPFRDRRNCTDRLIRDHIYCPAPCCPIRITRVAPSPSEQHQDVGSPCLHTRSRFEPSVWGPNVKVVLTQRGSPTREPERFGPFLWGPVVKVGVTFGPQRFSFELESGAAKAAARLTLCPTGDTKRPRGHSLSGFSVNYRDAGIPRWMTGSPKRTVYEPFSVLWD
jgi:hypothetical protein